MMRLKFRYKVFVTFFVHSLAVIVCMLLISRFYAHRNFEEYVGKVELERVDEFANALGKEYQKTMSWNPMLSNWNDWLGLMTIWPWPAPGTAVGAGRPFLPPLPPPPPPVGRDPGQPEHVFSGNQPPHPPGHHSDIAQRICLFDAEKRPLIGATSFPPDSYNMKPIMVKGKLAGWLGTIRPGRLTRPLDLEFIRRQSQMFYSIGGVALILAILVTMVLSRHLLTPVKKLAEGTRALTLRRFETRIEVRSPDEFGQLTADFNAMAQALEKYEQLRRQWIADISHELRTPLAILRGEIEAMQDGVREITPKALDSLHFEVLHVSRIVQDLHDISLLESRDSGTELTLVNPLEILAETLESFHTRLEQRAIEIDSKVNATEQGVIAADPSRLKQLFSNLLENTLRYANTPGLLKISHQLRADSIFLSFEDSGPGVPEESLERLFDRLYRVDKARSRVQGGSGLGLAICKSIVESCGGHIEASNVPEAGLKISMRFPVAQARWQDGSRLAPESGSV